MIACFSIPFFAAAVEQRIGSSPENRPDQEPALVIGGQPWEPNPVYAFSFEAARSGVRPGMSLRLAHMLAPQSDFLPADPPRYLTASGEVTDILTDFTHLVEPEEVWLPEFSREQPQTAASRTLPARYNLDLEHLPMDEALPLSREMGRKIREQSRLAPAVGLAQDKFTAQVAAASARPNHARPILAGEEGRYLSSRSIYFLPLHKEDRRRLQLLGIHTMGQLATLPSSSVLNQFGVAFMPIFRLAKGEAAAESSAIFPREQEKEERAAFSFDEPVANLVVLENVLQRLAMETGGKLQARSLEGRKIQLLWETERSNEKSAATVTLRNPTADPRRLDGALRQLMAQIVNQDTLLEDGVASLVVSVSDLTSATAWQLKIPLGVSRLAANLAFQTCQIFANLSAKYGERLFYHPVINNSQHPLPERRFQLEDMVLA